MDFKNIIVKNVQEEIQETELEPPPPTPRKKIIKFSDRPYSSFFVTSDQIPGYRNMSNREWLNFHKDDIDMHFIDVVQEIKRTFPKFKPEKNTDIYRKFQLLAFQNSAE